MPDPLLVVRRLTFLFAFAAAACTTGQRAAPPAVDASVPPAGHPELDATLWVQTSAEYDALARQAFRLAETSLEAGVADSQWIAALEQEPPYATLPPAVIVDVDETVLDNTAYQARRIRAGGGFTPDTWGAWVAEARAAAVPGAAGFARRADSLGVTVFYITNRDHELEPGTRRNLEAEGFPLEPGVDVLLTLGEEGWDSDKGPRRAAVAARYRVLLLVGDDLNDFVPARVSRAEREALLERHDAWWGRRWILLPNPIYGSWEDALLGFERVTDEEAIRRKQDALDTATP